MIPPPETWTVWVLLKRFLFYFLLASTAAYRVLFALPVCNSCTSHVLYEFFAYLFYRQSFLGVRKQTLPAFSSDQPAISNFLSLFTMYEALSLLI